MGMLVVKPKDQTVGLIVPQLPIGPAVLVLSATSTTAQVVFKVKKFDPHKHPHGAKGLFIDTFHEDAPKHAHGLQPGDVFATHSGKAFKVEKKTDKGVKVNPVDLDTGEVKSGYTVIGHDVPVNVIDKAHAVGSTHNVGDLEPGTYIKTIKADKRFKISKHGKWTTIYPVNDHGDVSGKHTVLPPNTLVVVDAPNVTGDITPQMVEHIDAVAKEVTDKPAKKSMPLDMQKATLADALAPHLADVMSGYLDLSDPEEAHIPHTLIIDTLNKNNGMPGNFYTFKDGLVSEAELYGFDFSNALVDGDPLDKLADPFTAGMAAVGEKIDMPIEQKVQEQLPTKLPAVPKPYPPGTGEKTKLRIEELYGDFIVTRTDEQGNRTILGRAKSKTAGRKLARDLSAPHEEIEEVHVTPKDQNILNVDLKKGDLVVTAYGHLLKIDHVGEVTAPDWQGNNKTIPEVWAHAVRTAQENEDQKQSEADAGEFEQKISTGTRIVPFKPDDKTYKSEDFFGKLKLTEDAYFQLATDQGRWQDLERSTLRPAHPEKFNKYLLADWSPDSLVGSSTNDALKTLTKIGYREIKPRQKDVVKVINQHGRRLQMSRQGDTITGVEQLSAYGLNIEGTAKDYHAQLAQTIESGGDLSSLDPSNWAPEAQSSHVRQLLYDMAVGHTKGVEAVSVSGQTKGGKVKSDEEYLAEMNLDKDVGPLAHWVDQVNMPPLKVRGRNGVLTALKDAGIVDPADPNIGELTANGVDYHFTEDLLPLEQAALQAIMRNRGVATLLMTPEQVPQTWRDAGDVKPDQPRAETLLGVHPVEAARSLAAGLKQWEYASPSIFDQLDPSTRTYLANIIKPLEPTMDAAQKSWHDGRLKKAEDFRRELAQHIIDDRRKKEGTVKAANAEFDLPVWSQVQFKAQTFADINQLVDNTDQQPQPKPTRVAVRAHIENEVKNALDHHGYGPSSQTTTLATLDQAFAYVDDSNYDNWTVDQVKASYNAYALSYSGINTPPMPFQMIPWDAINEWDQAKLAQPKFTDVPAFYTGGLVKDGVLQHGAMRTTADIPLEHDATIISRLEQLGAVREANTDPLDPGYSGSAKLYHGEQFTLRAPDVQTEVVDSTPRIGDVYNSGGILYRVVGVNPTTNETSMMRADSQSAVVKVWDPLTLGSATRESRIPGVTAKTWDDIKGTAKADFMDAVVEVHATQTHFAKAMADAMFDNKSSLGEALAGYTDQQVVDAFFSRLGGQSLEKRIEYVPHDQASWNAGGAPTNQRGLLRMYGFTPEQAAMALKDMGVVGDLEDAVPFESVLRSTRRYGAIAPIHSAYVRGESPLPKTPKRVGHGLTGGSSVDDLEKILESGGLMSIAERHRVGIKAHTTSPSGDIRSGIAHAVFGQWANGGACGGGSPIKIIYKPQAFLRRDIVLAPNDFGAADSRYPQYKSYLNKLQSDVGVPHTNLYAPVHPKVRQRHYDTATGGSMEFNVGPSVPIEDMEVITVSTQQDKTRVDALLDNMLSDGRIAARPVVLITGSVEANEAATKTTKGTADGGTA